jgi:fatty acid desaturase
MIFQILGDIFESIWDFLVIKYENRRKIIKSIILVICSIVIFLLDLWIFIIFFAWAQRPSMLVAVVVCVAIMITLQIGIWIDREKIHKWFLDNWDRASKKYQRR